MSEETNFNECIIRQKSDKKLTLVKEPKFVSLNALKNALEERNKCKDVSITGIYQRLDKLSAKDLEEKSAKYHSKCYKSCTHIKTIAQAKKRFQDSLQGKTLKTKAAVGRPEKRQADIDGEQSVAKRLRSSTDSIFDKKLCVICQKFRPESLHIVEYLEMGDKMLEVSRELSDKTLFLRLNAIAAADDGVANDVKYHRYCWIDIQRHMEKEQNQEIEANETNKVIADIEILDLVDWEIRSAGVLTMNDINLAYNEFLNSNSIEQEVFQDKKKYLKKLLQDNISDIEFTKPI